MASVKYNVRGKSNPSKISIRLVIDRQTDFKLTTPLLINPAFFNNKTGKVRQLTHFKDKDKIQNQLHALQTFVIDNYNNTIVKGGFISSDWLKNCINTHFNLIEVTDYNYLINYCTYYIEKLRTKTNDKTGTLGVSKATISKYSTIKTKISDFEKYKRKKYRLNDVNLKFKDAFLNYLLDVEKLSRNTVGRYIRFLKTIVLDAKQLGYKVSPELNQIKGFKVDIKKIYLNFDELQTIENTYFEDEQLQSAKDWLIIGCYIGQRVGDLLQLTSNNLTTNGKLDFIELVQQKTKKRVSILIHPKVQDILNTRGGQFPPTYSKNIDSAKTIFNRLIKKVCYKAKLTTIIEGGLINPKTNRKENGHFPKYKLITSHICRRSFATNHYGDMPTPLLLNITGHSTEKEFLNYIGKTNIDYAEQMAKYWNIQSQKQQKESVLKVAK
ncbi:site-specific integrase [Tamlana sp. 62-3]|uniref:Site-specific integrase n=1 Tax=Neotamlana sargassicola TaxID=2883125 RepID=A0A9X1I3N9_9FLAO|nr:phage integrase SAM-like domain-containing protein [Tamlana sargassicola]MCB4807137.1 site-specific integrase [Tamlana sargassicola]